MSGLISIIVPVYKVEPYLHKCVDSILAQTYTNFELILVDDGSPDTCPQICDEYAAKDDRIKVIHKENGDVSTARNAGLDICRGEYITFVDSDDWVEPEYVQVLYDALVAHDADFSQCNIRIMHLDGTVEILRGSQTENLLLDQDAAFENLMGDGWHFGINVLVWGKLYKRRCFETLRFHKGRYHEDDIAVCDVIAAEAFKCAVVIKDVLANYLEREVCRSKVVTSKELVDRYYSVLHMFRAIPKHCQGALDHKADEIIKRMIELITCASDRVLPIDQVLRERPDMADILKGMARVVTIRQLRISGASWSSVAFWLLMRWNVRLSLSIRNKLK